MEAFAKVELPVWRAYALGAGRGSKAAAEALAKPNVHWPSNFYDSRGLRYIDSGGNGAAMRIQPHAWVASSDESHVQMLREIVRNSVTTHGHPTAIVGACFHGLCVHHAIREGHVPQAQHLQQFASYLRDLPAIIMHDEALGSVWMPLWEQHTSRSLKDAFLQSQREMADDLIKVERFLPARNSDASIEHAYRDAIDTLDATRAEWRGSGSKTAVLAAFLSIIGQAKPQKALQIAANALNTDTDSIASMAGAILGGATPIDPPEQVMDADYISQQAKHLAEREEGHSNCAHNYPDLMCWSPPKTALDVVGLANGDYSVAGLGVATVKGEPIKDMRQQGVQWCWFQLSLGQTVLARMRTNTKPLAVGCLPQERDLLPTIAARGHYDSPLSPIPPTAVKKRREAEFPSLDEATDMVIASSFDAHLIGDLLLTFAGSPSGVDGAVAFAAIVAKAKLARLKRNRS